MCLCCSLTLLLYLLHHESAFERGNVIVHAQYVEEETLVVLHVGRLDAQHIVEAA